MIRIELTKKSATGKDLTWVGELQGNKIIVTHGQLGGKLQTKETVVTKGKNVGRSNETSPEQQALSELESTVRKQIEKDYELVSPYEFTTINEKQVKTQNKEIPSPMLAHPIDKHVKKVEGKTVGIQAKLDGFRAIYDVKNKKLYSRARKELIGCPHVIDQLSETDFGDIELLDGELYTPELEFETISKIVSPRRTLADETLRSKVGYYVFDYIDTNETFSSRYQILEDLFRKAPKFSKTVEKEGGEYAFVDNCRIHLVGSKFVTVDTIETSLKPLIQKYIEDGYEGLMVRIPDSKYECRRSHGLFKYKLFEDCEATCIGFKSEENNSDILGSITFKLKDGKEFDARPAMTEEARAKLWSSQIKYLGKIGVIKYQELSKYGIPRFPVFTGKWREKWDITEG
jgi:DNA ligase-1